MSGREYSVGVSVAPRDPGWTRAEAAEFAALTERDPMRSVPTLAAELLPTVRSRAAAAALLQQITVAEAMLAGLRVHTVEQLAASAPAVPATAGNEPAEFFPDELAMILGCSTRAAAMLADQCTVLARHLPATLAALEAGRLDWPRARVIADQIARHGGPLDRARLRDLEHRLLPGAGESSLRQLAADVRAGLLAGDQTAADQRRAQAAQRADVTVRRGRDGMSRLTAYLPHEQADAVEDTLDQTARTARTGGDPRPLGMLRVEALVGRILRPTDTHTPVTATLTIDVPLAALRAAAPGTVGHFLDTGAAPPAALVPPERLPTVDGEPLTATHLRALLTELDALCPGGLQPPSEGALHFAFVDAAGVLHATATFDELKRAARQESDTAVLGRPDDTSDYRPRAGQYRFVKARDRTCRHPSCHNRAAWADLDHVIAHADGGPTSCTNLCCLCRRHHRLKTHAPGWTHTMTTDGILTVTTPSHVTRATRPPRMHPARARPAAHDSG